MTLIGALSSFRKPREISPHKRRSHLERGPSFEVPIHVQVKFDHSILGRFAGFIVGIGPTIWRAGVSESSDQAGSRTPSLKYFIYTEMIS